MLTIVVGFGCDYPGCGKGHTRRRASADVRPIGDDFDLPKDWKVLQTAGEEDASIYCPDHPLKFEHGTVVLARRVGFNLNETPTEDTPE